ncbi:hydantoinase/oxoprolinase family protein [Ignicoccus hospitalis]|uniref:hydantoinase/oxoprolinase family protein n=1 Tax=Ignicoccus hospitalis TaxID=160233 RepID=UPI001EE34033|nr:hydantoinase/oxoprolinase family protein [Ignicoccus hospitalis]
MREFLRKTQVEPEDVGIVVHATTIATNALLGQEGLELGEVSLVTTKGFEDIIEIARQSRPALYDFSGRRPKPLVPPELRFGVEERTSWDGRVLKEVDEGELASLAPKLRGTVAVCFLHSYSNPHNEAKAKDVLRNLGFEVVASHESVMEMREYERFSTTIINAALRPVVSSYLLKFRKGLDELGIRAPLMVVASSGGLVDEEEAKARPGQLIESGPAGGAVGAAAYAAELGVEEALAFDMGGTTAKASVVVKGRPALVHEYEVGGKVHAGRVVKGSGYPVRYPFVDVAEVSAGGGTVAWEEGGALRVGPKSAGADPGPACYGRGGKQPTVTDADLLLGRLPEELPTGLKLRRDLALEAYSELARRLSAEPLEVAAAVIEAITEEMARVVRVVTVERGLDPSDLVMIAYGGMGPLHGPELAEFLGMKEVLVPPGAGVFTAVGMLFADAMYSTSKTVNAPADEDLEPTYAELEGVAVSRMKAASMEPDEVLRTAEARYEGQGWTVEVPVPRPYSPQAVKRAFEEEHERRYGFTLDSEVIVETARVYTIHKSPKVRVKAPPTGPELLWEGEAWFLKRGWEEARAYARFGKGEVEGPAIIVDYDSVTLVPPGWSAKALEDGSLLLKKGST